MANMGEKAENLFKIYLVYLRDCSNISIPHIGSIESVGFAGTEFNKFPENINLDTLISLSDDEVENLLSTLGISKAPSQSKSDVYVNGFGISLKSLKDSPPALVNHTSRLGFSKVADRIGVDISLLDKLIENYWNLRCNGQIGEDISNSNDLSPFANSTAKSILMPYLNYFLFDGTGKDYSKFRAEFLLDFTNPFDESTWHIYTRDNAIDDDIYSRLFFSLRAKKGMPKNYPDIKGTDFDIISPWTRFIDNEYRGALHIRIR